MRFCLKEKSKKDTAIVCKTCETRNSKKNDTCVGCGSAIEKPVKEPKVQLSESELVHKEANKIMSQIHRLRDTTKHSDKKDFVTNTDLWLDSDFFFSIVFQSSQQKYAFLEAFSKMFKVDIDTSKDERIQIINGLKLAESLDIALKQETALQYPYPDLELRKLALDEEQI